MRKIACYTDSLLEVYYKEFVRDTDKFFRASKLTLEHMKESFSMKGENWKIIGQLDSKEMVCQNVETKAVYAIDRIEVQNAILGETKVDIPKERCLKPLKKTK
jgi:hypothetical protein